MAERSARLVIVTSGDPAAAIVVNSVAKAVPGTTVMLDAPVSRAAFLKRRARVIGWPATLHQMPVMFMGKFVKPLLKKRYDQITRDHDARMELDPALGAHSIGNVNDPTAIDTINAEQPAAVLLVGARMLQRATIAAINAPIWNFHSGINPAYRGLNGGYWALARGDHANYGTTLHHVDAGVDTGAIIAQYRFKADPRDWLPTHQHALAALSARPLADTIRACLAGPVPVVEPDLPSQQHFHPGLLPYLWTGMRRGVW